MKVVEILKLEQKTLETLQDYCIKVTDVQYLPLYDDYLEMIGKYKISYISAFLSDKYGISERQFFYIIKRFGLDCNLCAVG